MNHVRYFTWFIHYWYSPSKMSLELNIQYISLHYSHITPLWQVLWTIEMSSLIESQKPDRGNPLLIPRLTTFYPRLLNILKNTWFTDESWFYSDGIAQKSNSFYWALSKESVKPIIFQKYPISYSQAFLWLGYS